MPLKIGDKVVKNTGDYFFGGTVVSVFEKLKGNATRVVVENSDGVLHIFNPSQLQKVCEDGW